jgi:mono/diheme cytochrome c family protein
MNRNGLILLSVLGMSICQPGAGRADSSPRADSDVASEARRVFEVRCTHCHGAQLVKPKGGFGYILDLPRVASNPEIVVPFRPDESRLWELVQSGEMPPPDSPTGTLTAAQKETIRQWIASGAPSPASSASSQLQEDTGAAAPSAGWRFLRWAGKFHLLVLHFPIALFIAAALAECWSIWRATRAPSPVVHFCVLLGAAAAVVTAGLGWLHALTGYGAGQPQLLALHRWFGTAAALWMVVAAVVFERDARRGTRSWQARVLLFVGTLIVALTAHFGGILAHGEDFFSW